MSDYRRAYMPGGQFFLTLVTERRKPLFADKLNVDRLRHAVATTISLRPFAMIGAVILPDHLHWLIELPAGDTDFSTRVGMIKAGFTKQLSPTELPNTARSLSRVRRRESAVWQRRFWEHTIRDEHDFDAHMNYIHYNPVKHGYVECPHAWPHSSFGQWVRRGVCRADWACVCEGRRPIPPNFDSITAFAHE
ncbi:MAG: REP-associated tyrosine transposase [Phycisphaerae bacterium]